MQRALLTTFLAVSLTAFAGCASGDNALGAAITGTVFATTSGGGTLASPSYRMTVRVGAPPAGTTSSANHVLRVGPEARR